MMADFDMDALESLPSWLRLNIAATSAWNAQLVNDVEETLLIQLTLGDLALLMYGLNIIEFLSPELGDAAMRIFKKIKELEHAQEFFLRINEKHKDDSGEEAGFSDG